VTHLEFDLTDLQVTQLREVLDALPLRPYAPLVNTMLPRLPLVTPVGPPPSNIVVMPAPELRRLQSRLPHGGSL
jgi:hypothetical protein